MDIEVNCLDTLGNTSDKTYHLSKLGFVKHFAIAGQGYSPRPRKLMRAIGMLLHYSLYLNRAALNHNRFSEPEIILSDPTEKGQFSNLVGKALADFLSKRIDNSFFTVNYEAAMRASGLLIRGPRPDLIAFKNNAMFALEAKGRSSRNPGDMPKYKLQANTGPLPTNFSIACISYNLFEKVKCNYHDPFNENIPFDDKMLSEISKQYYSGLMQFLDPKLFNYNIVEIQDEQFYEINLSNGYFRRILKSIPFRRIWFYEEFIFHNLYLLLPSKINEYARNGLTKNIRPFFLKDESNYLYIDTDRVGLRIY